jgi:hypothetical protein
MTDDPDRIKAAVVTMAEALAHSMVEYGAGSISMGIDCEPGMYGLVVMVVKGERAAAALKAFGEFQDSDDDETADDDDWGT